MSAFKDIDGKIPAQPGDSVALLTCDAASYADWVQAIRPAMPLLDFVTMHDYDGSLSYWHEVLRRHPEFLDDCRQR